MIYEFTLNNKALYSADEKPLKIGEIDLPCYVLDNGMRVLSQRGMLKAVGMSLSGTNKKGEHRLEAFLATKPLNPFIDEALVARIKEPVKFTPIRGGNHAFGYDAEVLHFAPS